MTVAEKIRHRRVMYGYTQAELGERLGLTGRTIRLWESGALAVLEKYKDTLAMVFDVNAEYFNDTVDK